MQERLRRSNEDRSDSTRRALTDAARQQFAAKGYADTGTPEIVAAAGVTRGALYHHFADKLDLFRAVALQEAEQVSERIEAAAVDAADPARALVEGTAAYFAAMETPGTTRILLIDAPAVLPAAAMNEIVLAAGERSLREGLRALIGDAVPSDVLDSLSRMLSAAFDAAALAIAAGKEPASCIEAVKVLVRSLASYSKGVGGLTESR